MQIGRSPRPATALTTRSPGFGGTNGRAATEAGTGPAQSEGTAVDRLLAQLNAMQVRDPARWAAMGPVYYAHLLRWSVHQADVTPDVALTRANAARQGTCCYALRLFTDWEDCQKTRGLTTARDIEKALRWDPTTPFCEGKGFEIVTQYLVQQRSRVAQGTFAVSEKP